MHLSKNVYNSRSVLERTLRDHALRVNQEKLRQASDNLKANMTKLREAKSLEEARGYEGNSAAEYFAVFDDLILQQKEDFYFKGRCKRPALDYVNSLLSFAYTLLARETAAALSTVGLDPYVGFLHRDLPGRTSLALDLMEELRSIYADRFVLSLINKRMIKAKDFVTMENGAVYLQDDARKTFLTAWQERKYDNIEHPFLREKIQWGLVPYAQASLLVRFIRGDLEAYPPFFWK